MRGRWCLLAAALLLGCGDSGPTPPKTYPVKGRVVYSDGTPMPGGSITFLLTSGNPEQSALGDMDSNGEFALRTIFGNKRLTGAVEGTFEVTIQPPLGSSKSPEPGTTLPDLVELKAGKPLELTLTYPGPKPL